MSRVLVVMGRELRASLGSGVALVTIGLFVVLQAALLFFVGYPLGSSPLPGLWAGGEASLAVLFRWLPLLLSLLVPALCMGAWADERRAGTEALLFSWPLRPVEVVLGKLLAAWLFLALLLAGTILPLATSVAWLGQLDLAVVAAGLVGSILLAGALASLALWVSALADEPLVAFLLGALLLGSLWGARLLAPLAPAWLAPALVELSPATHFLDGAARGVLDLRDGLHLASWILVGLALNASAVRARTRGPAPARSVELAHARWRAGRWNAALFTLLLLGIAAEANVLGARHLRLRADVSEDGLHELAPSTREILGRLDGRLQLKAFFSRELESGSLELARARVLGQLEELAAAGEGHIRLDVVDPSARADVLAEAEAYGIRPRVFERQVGTLARSERVFLGLVLRYRGRESVLPFVSPRDLEVQVATRIQGLLRERAPVVGVYAGAGGPYDARFDSALALLRQQEYEVRELLAPGDWEAELDVIVVIAPRELAEAEVAALEAHVLGGGDALLCLDEVLVDASAEAVPVKTGLDPLLRAFGVTLYDHHVWDDPWKAPFPDPRAGRYVGYPLSLALRAEGFAGEVPATAGLQGARLSWAQPVELVEGADPEVSREVLFTSSPDAYPVDLIEGPLVLEEELLESRSALEYARGSGLEVPLARLLEGRLTGRDGTPAVLPSRVVVVGDSDWLRDPAAPPFFVADNQRLFLNLVDWLALDDSALVELRARQPVRRELRDFLAEERRDLGLGGEEPGRGVARLERDRELEARAARSATLRRWRVMLLPVGLTLLGLGVLGLGWRQLESRRPGILDEGEREVGS